MYQGKLAVKDFFATFANRWCELHIFETNNRKLLIYNDTKTF